MKIPTDCNKEDQKFPGQFNRMTQFTQDAYGQGTV